MPAAEVVKCVSWLPIAPTAALWEACGWHGAECWHVANALAEHFTAPKPFAVARGRETWVSRLRQVPVIQRDHGLNLGGQERVDQAAVKREAIRAHRAAAAGDHTRPGDREAEMRKAQALHKLDVLRVAVVEVVRHVGCQAHIDYDGQSFRLVVGSGGARSLAGCSRQTLPGMLAQALLLVCAALCPARQSST